MSIISDVSKRILIVKGLEEVTRITMLYYNDEKIHQVNAIKLKNDLYEIEIIYSVGNYFKK